jgi:ribosomal protein S15P/S13E
VNQRKRLLAYLSKNDPKKYNDILKKLNLRK